LRNVARLRAAGPAIEQRKTMRADRSRITVQLPADVVNRLRNAVYWTPGITVTGFLSRCIVETVNRMESERGDVFPSRTTELRPGRPRK
jgi:hypothetical protein